MDDDLSILGVIPSDRKQLENMGITTLEQVAQATAVELGMGSTKGTMLIQRARKIISNKNIENILIKDEDHVDIHVKKADRAVVKSVLTILDVYAGGHGNAFLQIEGNILKLSRKSRGFDSILQKADALLEVLEVNKTNSFVGGELGEIIEAIKSFKPFMEYGEERSYQIDLARWLHSKYSNLKIEQTSGSTRPDIIIGNLAIEIKGPTYDVDLQTIADKCLRYSQHYEKMIVVLFNVHVNEGRYNEWLKGMQKTFPDVIIIKK